VLVGAIFMINGLTHLLKRFLLLSFASVNHAVAVSH
jgi:hypothetical protein